MEEFASFGAWLKARRRALDLTQEQVAQRLGVALGTLRKWETEERRPTRALAAQLAEVLALPATERPFFLKVARGERGADRLPRALSDQLRPTPHHPPTNLPLQRARFIGRERDLHAVRALLDRTDVGLVTLTGVGGIGKTRLALQVAADLLDVFPDGVWFVDLAPLSDPALVIPAIAQSLNVQEDAGQSLLVRLQHVLRDKHLLLLLDNCEQVVDSAEAIARLLGAAPRLKLLVTSRAPFHLSAEHAYAVPPLALPDPQYLPPVDTLVQYEAVALFIQRSQAARTDFQVTPASAPAIAAICQRLDGLPLAIELAAARSTLLPPAALLQRLSNRLAVLTGGARDLPARQQTLRNTIEWSYNLLEPAEQRLFMRLAVFAGGWTVEAAEAVCNAAGELELEVLDGLQSLVDKSLVTQSSNPPSIQKPEEPRFSMLETIREYAVERLETSSEAELLRQRHAEYYLALAEAAELLGPQQGVWLARLEGEHDNLRVALRWALEQGGGDLAARLRAALYPFWERGGHLSEGRAWVERVLAQSRIEPAPAATRAQALYGAAELAYLQGDDAHALARVAEGLELFRNLGDTRGTAWMLTTSARVARRQDGNARATEQLTASLELFRELGDERGIATLLKDLADVAQHQGDQGRAARLYAESLALFRGLGDIRNIACILDGLGEVAQRQGDAARAMALRAEGLALFQELGDRRGVAEVLLAQGRSALGTGEYERAVALLHESLALFRELGVRWAIAAALLNLGDGALGRGDHVEASRCFQEALAIFQEQGDVLDAGFVLLGLGAVAQAQGDHAQATALLEESLALFRRTEHAYGIAEALLVLGRIVHTQGDERRALRLLAESLGVYHKLGDKLWTSECLITFAGVIGATGDQAQRAARLFGAADALRETLNARLAPGNRPGYDRDVAAVRAQLDEATFAAAWAEGRATSLEQAIADALDALAEPRVPGAALSGTAGQGRAQLSARPVTRLTTREIEVLGLVAEGYMDQEVAARLGLRRRTVTSYLTTIYAKLEVGTRTAAVRAAREQELI